EPRRGLHPRPTDYESAALTGCATGPCPPRRAVRNLSRRTVVTWPDTAVSRLRHRGGWGTAGAAARRAEGVRIPCRLRRDRRFIMPLTSEYRVASMGADRKSGV